MQRLGLACHGSRSGSAAPERMCCWNSFERYLLAEARAWAVGNCLVAYVSRAGPVSAGLSPRRPGRDVTAADVAAGGSCWRSRGGFSGERDGQKLRRGLAALLRFCLSRADAVDLSRAALPRHRDGDVALPKGSTRAEARALAPGVVITLGTGRRDYAVIITLLRLGLRAGRKRGGAALHSDDIDWRQKPS